MTSETTTANRQIARAAGTVMAAFILSNLVGLARNILVTHAFGASAETDAFYASNRLADLLFNLVAGGALASAFVPTFTGMLTKDDRQGAWRLASGVINLAVLVLVAVSVISAIYAPWLVRNVLYLLAPDQGVVQEGMTAYLLRIQLISVTIFGVSGLVMGILNAHQSFLFPALAPTLYNLGWIVGAVFFSPRWGIYGLAWGVVLGAALHLVIQVPSLLRLKGQYWPSLGLNNPSVRQVFRLMGPRIFGVAVVQLNFIVNTIIAMGLPSGSVTAVTYGFSLMLMPEMAIAQSAATAALPTFSAQLALDRLDQMRASLSATLRAVLLLAVPASLGMAMLARPLVAVLYQRGTFTAEDTTLVSWALLWYSVGLIGHCLVEILSRAFYAMRDTRTPVLVGATAMALNIGLSLTLTRVFAASGWIPLGGLALANTLATGLEAITLLALMNKRLHGFEGRDLLQGTGAALLSGAAMGLALWLWKNQTADLSVWIVALGGVALGVGIYGLGMYILRVRELNTLYHVLRRKLRRA